MKSLQSYRVNQDTIQMEVITKVILKDKPHLFDLDNLYKDMIILDSIIRFNI